MAVNKNFVVKNGLEVNSNLLVADLDTQTVGIGTTIAPHELHVVGGIGVTNLLVTGVATIGNLRVTGPSTFIGVSTFVDGNVHIQKSLFVNGINITGGSGGSIGTDLHIQRHVRAGGIVTFSDSLFVGSGLGQSTGTSGQVLQVAGVSSGAYFGGQVGIGTTNPAGGGAGDVALHVVGDSRFVGLTTFTGITTFQSDVSVQGSLKVTGDITYDEITGRNLNISGLATFQTLTAGRVALVGTGDTLTDDANLTFVKGGTQLVVGVGATVGGGLTVAGVTVFDNDVEFKGVNGITSVSFDKSANALNFVDRAKATFGTGSDLTIDHDGTNTSLTNITGNIDITTTDADKDIKLVADNGSGGTTNYVICDGSTGQVKLAFYGDIKLNTTTKGIHVDGEIETDSVGIADSIFHVGDDNTQIRFPAADTFTVETAGVERLRVASDGNIGIGSQDPQKLLDLTASNNGGNENNTLRFVDRDVSSGADQQTGRIEFFTSDVSQPGVQAYILGAAENAAGAGGLRFATGTAGSAEERVRVTSAGDVGIGTITPTGSHAVTASNEAVLAVGIATARKVFSDSLEVGGSQVISSARQLQNIASLDSTTTATIESAIANAPNTFTDIEVTGIATFKSTVKVEDLAPNRVVFVGAGDSLTDDANFTFDRSQLILGVGATVGGALTVAGIATFASAVGIAESIFHVGDPNTSFGFPAADTFTVDTGGTEALRVDSDQRLLIRATSTTGNQNDADLLVQGNSTQGEIYMSRGGTPADNGGGLGFVVFTGGNGADAASIRSYSDGGTWTNGSSHPSRIEFATTPDGSSTPVTRLIVGAEGDVDFKGVDGITSMSFDRSSNSLDFVDDAKAQFGTGNDLKIYHDGSVNRVRFDVNTVFEKNDSTDIATFLPDGAVTLFHNGTEKIRTGSDGVIATGIVTATGGFDIGIHSAGTSVVSGPVKILNFVGTGNTFAYNASTDTIDISIAGGSGGGGGSGVTETDTTVSTVNPTGVGSFAAASFRSASVIAQINQLNTDFQVGRYLMIHDGTTVTVVEESAVSTGSTMLGSFTGVIDGSNVELRVTLASAGVSTVTTKIDTVTV